MDTSVYKSRIFPNTPFFSEVERLLKDNLKVTFHAKGGSMRPFLQDGDTVRLAPIIPGQVRKGDIVLAHTAFGILLHRVVSIRKDQIVLAGDANRRLEYTDESRIIGVVDAAWRGKRELRVNGFPKRVLACLWYGLRPFRGHLLGIYERCKHIRKRKWN